MGCEESFITIKLIWYGYLVYSLGIYVHKTSTETDLMIACTQISEHTVDSDVPVNFFLEGINT